MRAIWGNCISSQMSPNAPKVQQSPNPITYASHLQEHKDGQIDDDRKAWNPWANGKLMYKV